MSDDIIARQISVEVEFQHGNGSSDIAIIGAVSHVPRIGESIRRIDPLVREERPYVITEIDWAPDLQRAYITTRQYPEEGSK
jgi:hypothetical protein